MTQDEIQRLQKHVGAVPDGWWGPKSIAACQAHLRKLMPVPNPWPKTDQASLTKFYGKPGDESKMVTIPLPAGVKMYYDGRLISGIYCHKKVAESLSRALQRAYLLNSRVVGDYYGVYNNRPMRGGSLPRLHARGAAIDLDADANTYSRSWPIRASMPIEVMESFAREGWLSAGAMWGYDAMHFQSTQ
jgi:hypothetical protein